MKELLVILALFLVAAASISESQKSARAVHSIAQQTNWPNSN